MFGRRNRNLRQIEASECVQLFHPVTRSLWSPRLAREKVLGTGCTVQQYSSAAASKKKWITVWCAWTVADMAERPS